MTRCEQYKLEYTQHAGIQNCTSFIRLNYTECKPIGLHKWITRIFLTNNDREYKNYKNGKSCFTRYKKQCCPYQKRSCTITAIINRLCNIIAILAERCGLFCQICWIDVISQACSNLLLRWKMHRRLAPEFAAPPCLHTIHPLNMFRSVTSQHQTPQVFLPR
jgi:hypothetical protein